MCRLTSWTWRRAAIVKKLTAAAPALDPELLLAMFEAKTDIWAIDVKLTRFIKSVAMVMRSLPGVPPSERERIIAKQEALVDALVRAAHVEGMLRGGKDVLESLGVKARREAGS
jgi:hypothetical protein